ncbi:MAG: hypothetical protein ACK4WH_04595, partial [Phycisphaerales bacterium]
MSSKSERSSVVAVRVRRAPVQVEVRRVDLNPARPEEASFARRLLEAEASAIRSLSAVIGLPFHRAVGMLVACADAGGNVLVSGLGKSGLIGQKISATLA